MREGLTVNKALEEQEEEVTSSPNTAHVKHQVFFPRVFGCLLSKNRGLLHIVRIYNDVSGICDALEQGPTASETINLQSTISSARGTLEAGTYQIYMYKKRSEGFEFIKWRRKHTVIVYVLTSPRSSVKVSAEAGPTYHTY